MLLARALASLEGQLDEPVVLDHFETFELTQDLPVGVATPVGAKSWFVYGIDSAPHARAGRRSRAQERLRKKRAEDIQLEVHPNPKRGPKGSPRSPIARARDQAMFPVDLLHALLRHSLAAHKRETIAFGRRLFPVREKLSGTWLEIYRRDWLTPELPSNARHRRVFAY